jgi:hypothetical protein
LTTVGLLQAIQTHAWFDSTLLRIGPANTSGNDENFDGVFSLQESSNDKNYLS